MSDQRTLAPTKTTTGAIVIALLLDMAFVVVFAALGRAEHGGAVQLGELWGAAWPFLAALALMWVAVRAPKRPLAVWPTGVWIWVGTVAVGMLLRVIFTSGGAALPFVLVASGMLGLTLVGWRLVAALILVLRRKRKQA